MKECPTKVTALATKEDSRLRGSVSWEIHAGIERYHRKFVIFSLHYNCRWFTWRAN